MTPNHEVTNAELFLFSLHELGGGAGFVDVEDVFVKSFEHAPARLSWRTRHDLPDYKKCSKGLRDAEARSPKLLVKTADGLRRQLTVEGRLWIQKNEQRLGGILGTERVVQEPASRPRARLLAAAEQSDAYQLWKTASSITEKKWQIADLLRCSSDSDPRLWRERLQVLRSAASAAGRDDLLEFLDTVSRERIDWFGQE